LQQLLQPNGHAIAGRVWQRWWTDADSMNCCKVLLLLPLLMCGGRASCRAGLAACTDAGTRCICSRHNSALMVRILRYLCTILLPLTCSAAEYAAAAHLHTPEAHESCQQCCWQVPACSCLLDFLLRARDLR
jgi:hypothetical protein